ncbi:glycosyl hydrolase [Aspergillus cavernicola]|uniref:Glycosyl hydrolase n=1 Tax=Aspergillus cavernicola TaxID=176166 RepID=A0ABR4HEA5_9EURO
MSPPTNPIIPGFSPDPSIVKVGDWYFLVNSTFHMFPGIPVYASQDLVSWKQIGNVINRRTQLSLALSDTTLTQLEKPGEIMLATGGLYAPSIRHHNGTFYVVCTNVIHADGRDAWENFICSTTDIWCNTWSDPVYFEFKGIDPSILLDDDGKAYIQGSAAPGPYTKINMFEVDLKSGARLSEEKTLWGGTGGIYPEGPHLYKRQGWYYLLISEGGTHDGHMITMARSKDIWGPYEACPENPVLTACGTEEYIQCTGHCDAFQDDEQRWWGVCLGIRKGKGGRAIMGRETFLTRGTWDGEWLSFDRVKPNVSEGLQATKTGSGISAAPGVDNLYIRDAVLENYKFGDASSITLTASPIDLSHPEISPTFVGRRQRLLSGRSSVAIQRIADHAGSQSALRCGLASYKDEHRYVRIFYNSALNTVNFELVNNAKKISRAESHTLERTADVDSLLCLRIEYTEDTYRLAYADLDHPKQKWRCLAEVDTMDMTDPDFTGPVIGIFAVAETEGAQVGFKDLEID